MKQALLCTLLFISLKPFAQNVGINTNSPAEKLDVNGNINLTGQLKVNGNAGSANQVLMKNSANALVWAELSKFQNMVVFNCNGIASTFGSNNCPGTWNIPAGVTEIAVEMWGGGGGGSMLSGGAGAGYLFAKFNVSPGQQLSFEVAAGGNFGISNPIAGGNSQMSYPGITLLAGGGSAGIVGDPNTTISVFAVPTGGSSNAFGVTHAIAYTGSPGEISKLKFMTVGASEFARVIEYGRGGDAALMPGTGGVGGYRIISTSINQILRVSNHTFNFGSGGGADPQGGAAGGTGRIVIYY